MERMLQNALKLRLWTLLPQLPRLLHSACLQLSAYGVAEGCTIVGRPDQGLRGRTRAWVVGGPEVGWRAQGVVAAAPACIAAQQLCSKVVMLHSSCRWRSELAAAKPPAVAWREARHSHARQPHRQRS